jgi:hypothetical protein
VNNLARKQGNSPNECWVCGNPVPAEDHGIDEFGFSVHAECNHERMTEKDNRKHFSVTSKKKANPITS